MKSIQEWVNKFNKVFGLNVWIGNVENGDSVKLEIESPTGINIGTIVLVKYKENWRFSTISSFNGESWKQLTSI